MNELEQQIFNCGTFFYENFWEYTIGECKHIIEMNNKKKKDELQLQAQMDYTQSLLTARLIGTMFSEKADVPDIEEVYPNLFAKELTKEEQEELENNKKLEEKVKEMIQIEQWKSMANRMNK